MKNNLRKIVTISALASEIHACGVYLRKNFTKGELKESGCDFCGTDCRLQVKGESWQLHTGSADYDQDHQGSWGCSSIPWGCNRKESREIARDLIDQVADDIAMNSE